MDTDDISGVIVDTAMRIHREIGPGMFESVYETLLAHLLTVRGFQVERQKGIAIHYGDLLVLDAFRADMVVAGTVIVEVKSLERLAPIHSKQLLSYLRLTGLQVGLLLNFGEPMLKDGIKRVVNNYTPAPTSPLAVNNRTFMRPFTTR